MSDLATKSLDDYIKDNKISMKSKQISKERDRGRPSRPSGRRPYGRGENSNFHERKSFHSYNNSDRRRPHHRQGGPARSEPWGERRDFTKRLGNPKAKVVINGLHHEVNEEELKTMFSEVGKVKDVKIVWDKYERSTGKAYVEFVDSETARKAIEEYNGEDVGLLLVC
eukprot:TRINITY_DN852_c0_g1_i4.p1 TRINITY_DN852_c0_g1~~TRINITY_DN852_c0_g1_i4.p1  ORF type:complete len:168 (-),score=46.30 TRINITY_DN852_c0_g1_i4:268-771(-)